MLGTRLLLIRAASPGSAANTGPIHGFSVHPTHPQSCEPSSCWHSPDPGGSGVIRTTAVHTVAKGVTLVGNRDSGRNGGDCKGKG